MPVGMPYWQPLFDQHQEAEAKRRRTRVQPPPPRCGRCGQRMDLKVADAFPPYYPVPMVEMCFDDLLDQVSPREGDPCVVPEEARR